MLLEFRVEIYAMCTVLYPQALALCKLLRLLGLARDILRSVYTVIAFVVFSLIREQHSRNGRLGQ